MNKIIFLNLSYNYCGFKIKLKIPSCRERRSGFNSKQNSYRLASRLSSLKQFAALICQPNFGSKIIEFIITKLS